MAAWLVPIALVATAGVLVATPSGAVEDDSPAAAAFSLTEPAAVSELKSVVGPTPTPFVEPGVIPATNQWFSSLVFAQRADQASFAYPLAIAPAAEGFSLAYPSVTTTADVIAGAFTPQVGVSFGQTTSHTVAGYDALSVEVNWKGGGGTVASSRFTQGSPVAYTALKAGTVATIGGAGSVVSEVGPGVYGVAAAGRTFVVGGGQGVSVAGSGSAVTVTGSTDGASFGVGVVPDGGQASDLAAAVADPITSTAISFETAGDGFKTSFSVTTASGSPTLFALLPEQSAGVSPSSLGTYSTVAGQQLVVEGNEFSWTQAASAPAVALDLSKLTSEQKAKLTALVVDEAGSLSFGPDGGPRAPDTYFGGKYLQRAAELLDIAVQLGLDTQAASIQAKLSAELKEWFALDPGTSATEHYFTYDPTVRTIVGQKPSFGSDTDVNDHHFHYGYFLNAAAILLRHDPSFASFAPAVNLLAEDIANADPTSADFPVRRAFDNYAGHSWASGTSPFADGNNEESSSEGVNGWYGLYRWAVVTGNASLANDSLWAYSRESAAALRSWLNPDLSQPMYAGYGHSIVSMVWGGKATYETWFSPHPAAKLGIELLPMSPGQSYVGVDPERVRTNLAGVDGDGVFDGYMAMYLAYADPAAAEAAILALPDERIDNALTRAYALAFVWALPKGGTSLPASPAVPTSVAPEPSPQASPTSVAPEPAPEPAAPDPAPAPAGETVALFDDFSVNGAPDSTLWKPTLGTAYPNGPANFGTREVEVNTADPSNLAVRDGNLYITPQRDANGGWTSARLESVRTDYKPPAGGIMRSESRLQMPNVTGAEAQGYWPAFWMLGGPYRADRWSWPAVGEFDIMENVQGLNWSYGVLHCGYAAQWQGPCNEPEGLNNGNPDFSGPACPGSTCQEAFHTFTFEWDRTGSVDKLRWFIDGQQTHEVSEDQVPADVWSSMTDHEGYHVILNVAIGGAFPDKLGGGAWGSGGPFPSTKPGVPMVVDYVKVSYSGGGSTGPAPTSPAPTTPTTPTTPATVVPTTPTMVAPTTPAPTTPIPTTPAAVTELRAMRVTSSAIELAWPAVPGAARYGLLRAGIEIGSTEGTSIVDGGLLPGRPYIHSIRAYGADGGVLSTTKELTTTTPA